MNKLWLVTALSLATAVVATPGARAANGLFVNTGNPSDGLLAYHLYGSDPNGRGISFDYDTTSNPIWGLGLERTFGDLYLQSYTIGLDTLDMRGDTGQLNLGKGIGRPTNGGAQLGVTAGTSTAPLGGIGVTNFGGTTGLLLGQGDPKSHFTAVGFGGLFQLGTDVANTGGGDFTLWDLVHQTVAMQVSASDLVTMNAGAMINGTATVNGPTALLGSSTTVANILQHTGNQLGFYGAAPVTKPIVTGCTCDGSALKSLIQALASQGLVIDQTNP